MKCTGSTGFGYLVVLWALPGVFGHGALTKPMPRLVSGQEYCPWCVGEHQPVTNPSGSVHRDAEPSSPCLSSQPGDAPYTTNRYSSYQSYAAAGEPTYTAGGTMETRIVLDADHNGEAIFEYCPHSELSSLRISDRKMFPRQTNLGMDRCACILGRFESAGPLEIRADFPADSQSTS